LIFQNQIQTTSYNTNSACSSDCITSFLVDYTGNIVKGCNTQNLLALYDANGIYQNQKIVTSNNPFVTAVDSKGRLIVVTMYSLDIFY
jgi:hypothetical protein